MEETYFQTPQQNHEAGDGHLAVVWVYSSTTRQTC